MAFLFPAVLMSSITSWLCLSSDSFDVANGLPDFVSEERPRNCLSSDDIIDKYKEAISHYSKVRFTERWSDRWILALD